MPLFDATNRLTMDECATRLKDAGNSMQSAYTLTSLRPEAPSGTVVPEDHPLTTATAHRNLFVWDGYGTNRAAIDNDNKLRIDQQQTNWRERIQLPKRVFHANPALSRGKPEPDVEDKLINGQATAQRIGAIDAPDPLTEKAFPVFVPGVQAHAVHNVVSSWTRGGVASREVARSDTFMQQMGYVWDGRVWQRAG